MIESYSVGLIATVPVRINAQGAYFRLIDGTGVDVTFFRGGSIVGSARGMNSGFFARAKEGEVFDAVDLVSATAQSSKLLIGSAEAGAATAVSVSGEVAVSLPVAALTQSENSVGIASAQLVAAKVGRKFLLIQNNDTAAKVTLNVAGAAAVLGKGVILPPGASLLLDVVKPSAAVFAIADVATAAGVLTVVEG